jgi:hypothetical protein
MAVVVVQTDRIFFSKSQKERLDNTFANHICIDDFVDELQFLNARISNDTRVRQVTTWGLHMLTKS